MTQRGSCWKNLLVTVAIIAIAIAILYPMFARARGEALQKSCLSNCKQIGLTFAMYATDYDNKLPVYDNGSAPGFITDVLGQATKGNVPLLSPARPSNPREAPGMAYLKNMCILACPCDPVRPLTPSATPHGHTTLSYTWNELFAGYPQDKIAEPKSKILMICQGSVGDFTFVKPALNALGQYAGAWSTLAEPGNFVHQHGLNCLYLDGHAKWIAKDEWPVGGAIKPGNKASAYLIDSTPPESAADQAAEREYQQSEAGQDRTRLTTPRKPAKPAPH